MFNFKEVFVLGVVVLFFASLIIGFYAGLVYYLWNHFFAGLFSAPVMSKQVALVFGLLITSFVSYSFKIKEGQ